VAHRAVNLHGCALYLGPGAMRGVHEAACGARFLIRRAEPAASGRKVASVAEWKPPASQGPLAIGRVFEEGIPGGAFRLCRKGADAIKNAPGISPGGVSCSRWQTGFSTTSGQTAGSAIRPLPS